jgi:hypothetical protein
LKEGGIASGYGRGFVYKLERGIKPNLNIISTKLEQPLKLVEKAKNIEPVVSISKIEQLGGSRIVNVEDALKLTSEFGQGTIAKSATISKVGKRAFNIQTDKTAFAIKEGADKSYLLIGGRPTNVLTKTGIKYVVKEPNMMGRLFAEEEIVQTIKKTKPLIEQKTALNYFDVLERNRITPEIKTVKEQISLVAEEKLSEASGFASSLSRKAEESLLSDIKVSQITGGAIRETSGTLLLQQEKTKPISLSSQEEIVGVAEKEFFAPVQFQPSGEKAKEKTTIKQSPTLQNRFFEPQKPVEGLKSNQLIRFETAQVQRQTSRQKISSIYPQQEIAKKIKPTPFIPRILLRRYDEFKKEKAVGEKIFEVFGKRFGRDISKGKYTDIKKAKEEFVKFAKGTLGRSGFITENGKKVGFEELGLSGEFRPSKRDPFRIVQKAEFSLGTGSERREIQSAKKKKTKKVKWF